MKTTHTANKAKAVICFCLVFIVNGLTAQQGGSYKYVVISAYSGVSTSDMLEINNRYYVLSAEYDIDKDIYAPDRDIRAMISIFDEDLNQMEEIELSELGRDFVPRSMSYENNYFYIFGEVIVSENRHKPGMAKFDEHFKLVQPVSVFTMDDSASYIIRAHVLMTREKEFVCLVQYDNMEQQKYEPAARLLHINRKGEVLQDVFIPYLFRMSDVLETDSNYLVTDRTSSVENGKAYGVVLKVCKNSFDKHEWVKTERRGIFSRGAVTVGNQLIRTTENITTTPSYPSIIEEDVGIAIFDEDFGLKRHFLLGKDNVEDDSGILHYLNPDSIYCVYQTSTKVGYYRSISIANFSSEGVLHFDYALDLLKDSLSTKLVNGCKALSNGGVLVYGDVVDFSNENDVRFKGFLVLYHPTRTDLTFEPGTCVQEVTVVKREIYPNPAQSQFTVTNTENADIQLFNVLGQKVLQTCGTSENTVINTASLRQGLYVLKVVKDNFSTVHKVQVAR